MLRPRHCARTGHRDRPLCEGGSGDPDNAPEPVGGWLEEEGEQFRPTVGQGQAQRRASMFYLTITLGICHPVVLLDF